MPIGPGLVGIQAWYFPKGAYRRITIRVAVLFRRLCNRIGHVISMAPSAKFRAWIETDTPCTTGALIAEPKQVQARLRVAVERKPFESLRQPLAFID